MQAHLVMARVIILFLVLSGLLQATTLEQLSMDEMIGKSTAIVRGRVLSARAEQHKSIVYTHYSIQVVERWKGTPEENMDVVVPGGKVGNLSQRFAGTPELAPGFEYVLILWKGRNGLNQVIGLSQGVFNLKQDSRGEWILSRSGSDASMLDPTTGREVEDRPVRLSLREFTSKVRGRLVRE